MADLGHWWRLRGRPGLFAVVREDGWLEACGGERAEWRRVLGVGDAGGSGGVGALSMSRL